MARQLRIEYENAFYHITSRGNQREQIYWDDTDREEFIKILHRTKERYGYLIHAYVLMSNHYHVLIETPYANIKQIMQNINTSYTVYINRRHKRFGHLFQGRYKAFIVDKESYLLELGRYIHLNPVRAGIVRRAEDYIWSSYQDYVNSKRRLIVTDTDDTLFYFSKKRAIAAKKYREFIEAGEKEESPFSSVIGNVLGDETFRKKVMGYFKGTPDKVEIPEFKRVQARPEIEAILRATAKYYGIREEELLQRKKAAAKQHKLAIHLSKTLSGEKNSEVGKVFGITVQAVTNAIKDIEKSDRERKNLHKEITNIKEILK